MNLLMILLMQLLQCKAKPRHKATTTGISIDSKPREGLSEASEALNLQNKYRKNAGCTPLYWDSGLEKQAKLYAETLVEDCILAPSTQEVGETMASSSSDTFRMVEAVKLWGKEPVSPNSGVFNNHTQIVWCDTDIVGCARVSSPSCEIVVCHYMTPGNIPGESPM